MITINQLVLTLGLLVGFYILNHIIRLVTKLNYCAKCGSLIMTLATIAFLNYPVEIRALLVGSLFTISTYYADDFMMNKEGEIKILGFLVNKKKVNFIAQDFVILLCFLFIYLLVLLW